MCQCNWAGNTSICHLWYSNIKWTEGEVPGTTYGLSKKGWIDTELLYHWLQKHFLKYAVPARPLLLLHFQLEMVKYAKETEVIVFCLLPHTTHASQPLDAAVFGPLKQHWANACHKDMQKNPGKGITKYQFSGLFKEACWMETNKAFKYLCWIQKMWHLPFWPQRYWMYCKCDWNSYYTNNIHKTKWRYRKG